MAHAHERLAERALPVEAERAYALLRDHRLLAALIARAGSRDGALAQAERVAVPLADRESCAKLIVSREGHAITCLAAGMACNVPSLTYDEVDRHLTVETERLRVKMAAARVRSDEEAADLIVDSIHDAWRMNRAQFDVLRALAPLLVQDLFEEMIRQHETLAYIQLGSGRQTPFDTRKSAQAAFKLYSSAAVTLMACQEERAVMPAAFAAAQARDAWLCARGMWILVNHPERFLSFAEEKAIRLPIGLNGVGLPLAIIAFRFPWLKRSALAVAERFDAKPQAEEFFQQVREALATDDTRDQALAVWSAFLVHVALGAKERAVMDNPPLEQRLARLETVPSGTSFDGCISLITPELLPYAQLLNPLRDLSRQPATHPREESGLPKAERNRITLWRRGVTHFMAPILPDPFRALLMTLAPVEALLPAPVPDVMTLEYGVVLIQRVLPKLSAHERQPKRSSAPSVGRNEPCPCGSGNKFKKCCGVA